MNKHGSLKELAEATHGDPFIFYCGADPVYHHFEACDGRRFLLGRVDWNLHPVLSVDSGIRLFVTISDGKIKMADASATRNWQRRFPRAAAQTTEKWRLPVMRYDQSARPSLLILTSDGDWSHDELSKLDAILNDWLERACPLGTGIAAADRAAPRLRFDRANSVGDDKTILIRAENFETGWCESLAERLGTEFPFLWSLDVGYDPLQ